ncbi:MAG: DJ-1/PfpI family protein [Mucispirillum sp.]|nr:DJ-1/PfpI family protein [Mucispirillum sp.]
MKKAVVFLADGFEEMEALAPVDILRRGGVEVTMAGVTGMQITGAHNIKVMADKDVKEIKADDYDAFICPGGMPGASNLRDNSIVTDIIKEAYGKEKIVSAICAAPMVLDKAGVLADKNFTMYPGMQNYAPSGSYKSDEFVVKDGKVITGAGPAAVFEYAFKLLTELQGEETTSQVAEGMLFK